MQLTEERAAKAQAKAHVFKCDVDYGDYGRVYRMH